MVKSVLDIMDVTTQFFVLLLLSSFLVEGEGLRVGKQGETDKKQSSSETRRGRSETRRGKFLFPFSLFSVVTFENTACTTASGSQGVMKILLFM